MSARLSASLVVACYVAAVTPVLQWYVRRVMDRSDEPLGVVALITAVALFAKDYRGRRRSGPLIVRPALMLGGAILLALVQGTVLSHFPLVSGLLSVAVLGLSVRLPEGKAGIIVLLVLSLPLVASLDFYAGYPLRLAATHVAVALLNVCGLAVQRSGLLILDGGSIVGMDPPCAGVRMLWTACFTAAVVSVRERFAWARAMVLLGVAVMCVVLGNGVRAALVFFPESGRVHWPEWTHPALGLAVHGMVLAVVFAMGERISRWRRDCGGGAGFASWRGWSPKVAWAAGASLVTVAGLAVTWAAKDGANVRSAMVGDTSWPATLDGVPLVPIPLSAGEARFAQAFPGRLGKYRCGDREVILRRVATATRFMHPSSDCLRAAGFEVKSKPAHEDADGRLWGCAIATRGNDTWRVRERYVNAAQSRQQTDASAWFWEAVLHPGEGPWTAVTVMERVRDGDAVLAAR